MNKKTLVILIYTVGTLSIIWEILFKFKDAPYFFPCTLFIFLSVEPYSLNNEISDNRY